MPRRNTAVTVLQPCAVCHRPTSEFNYGVASCNACKIFYRRHMSGINPVKPCCNDETCFEIPPFIRCSSCRFKKCVKVGMVIPSYLHVEVKDQNWQNSFRKLVDKIARLDIKRLDLQKNYYVPNENITVSEAIAIKMQYFLKPSHYLMTFHSWSLITAITTIDFLKHFSFVKLLPHQDKCLLLSSSLMKVASYNGAIRAYRFQLNYLSFPDGSCVLPEFNCKTPIVSAQLENGIQCRLVGKLYELQVTKEESLLSIVIFFCQTANDELSETAKSILSSYQEIYSSALLQYCLARYKAYGPTRYTEILSIYQILIKHCDDVSSYFELCRLSYGSLELKNMVQEAIDGI